MIPNHDVKQATTSVLGQQHQARKSRDTNPESKTVQILK